MALLASQLLDFLRRHSCWTFPPRETPSTLGRVYLPMSELLIQAESVSKKFCRRLRKSLWYGVKDMAAEALGGSRSHDELRADEFWAVKDVSFELRRGECLGLIGHNGAGKTTLLKMLTGLIKPDHGSITLRGRVGALIALGAGFNPILTGRENVQVNASVLGLSRAEIDSRIDEIIDFSGIGDFIDAPVQNYSSGMQVRLGFAVATAMKPDILILDEVLAVGDAAFRHKCYTRIAQIQDHAAVIFVSHMMDQVARICDRAIYMEKGRPLVSGVVQDAVVGYERSLAIHDPDSALTHLTVNEPIRHFEFRLATPSLAIGEDLVSRILVESARTIHAVFFRILIYSLAGETVCEWSSEVTHPPQSLPAGRNGFEIRVHHLALRPGHYRVSFLITRKGTLEPVAWAHKVELLEVVGPRLGAAHYLVPEVSIAPVKDSTGPKT